MCLFFYLFLIARYERLPHSFIWSECLRGISSTPGTWRTTPCRHSIRILATGQSLDLALHGQSPSLASKVFGKCNRPKFGLTIEFRNRAHMFRYTLSWWRRAWSKQLDLLGGVSHSITRFLDLFFQCGILSNFCLSIFSLYFESNSVCNCSLTVVTLVTCYLRCEEKEKID